MSISHRTNRLKLFGTPAVEQLQNGRYQLTINCTTMNSREDWYSSNKARIFPDFGSLESAEMSIDGLAPRTGEAYTDMRLVSVQSSTQQGQYIVTLVYQTLGASFVQVKDDTVSYLENGLRRVTRKSIAKAGTDFQKTVGTTSITSQIDSETAVTCVLANYEVDDTDSYREVTEVYMEAGILNLDTPLIGGQQQVKVLAFNLTSSEVETLLSEVTENHKLIDSSVSNYRGIKSSQYTFEVDDFETNSQESNGLKVLIRTELSTTNFTDGDVGIDRYKTLTLSGEQIDNGNAIKKRTSLFSEHGLLDESKGDARNGIRNVSKTFLGTEESVNGPITSRIVQNANGIKTITVNFVEGEDGTEITGTAPGQLVKQSTQHEPFKIPGLVRLMKSEKTGGPVVETTVNYSFDLTPPVVTNVLTTSYVLYQTDNSVNPASDYTYQGARAFWNPGSWAKSRTSGIDVTGKPFSISKGYRGYRAPATYQRFTVNSGVLKRFPYFYAGQMNYYFAKTPHTGVFIDGYEMGVTTTPTVELSGGPENPVGRKYVTSVSISPAFTDLDGVQYYKKIIKVADVEGEQIDDAVYGDYGNNRLGSYTVTSNAGTAGSHFSVQLDDSYQAEDNEYNGYLFTVFPRAKDSENDFLEPQRMVVYDYKSDGNKILVGENINSGNVVGIYNAGDITANASYEFARMNLDDFATTGLKIKKFSKSKKKFTVAEGLMPEPGNLYSGYKIQFTSGSLNGSEFLIASSVNNILGIAEGTGTNQMSDTNYDAVSNDDTFSLIPPATF